LSTDRKDRDDASISSNIMDYVNRNGSEPFMISEVAEHVGTTFDTAKDHLLLLAATGVLGMKKINRHWIFWKAPKGSATAP